MGFKFQEKTELTISPRENAEYRKYQWYTCHYHINSVVVQFNEQLLEEIQSGWISLADVHDMMENRAVCDGVSLHMGYKNEYHQEEIFKRLFILIAYVNQGGV